jgi:hypothetical protein
MRAAGLALALATLVVGAGAGIASVAVHRTLPGIVLALAAPLWALLALRQWGAGATAAFAAGWLAALVAALLGRGEGDYVVAADLSGYLLIGGGFAVLAVAVTALAARSSGSGVTPT